MARMKQSALTKLQIVRVALRLFLENGYSSTSVKMICNELNISPGNLTFHFPTKEHLLAELTALLCRFHWKAVQEEMSDIDDRIVALCLKLMEMAAVCDEDPVSRDFHLSVYTSPLCMTIIRENGMARAKRVFESYRPSWDDEQFTEAAAMVSGIEYATLMTVGEGLPFDIRLAGALDLILTLYGVPADIRGRTVERVLTMDYRGIGRRVMEDFKQFVFEANEQAIRHLLNT